MVRFSFRVPPASAQIQIKEPTVKPNTHPVYRKITAVCACGNQFETRSTAQSVHVEVCSVCHPFYTGKVKFIDTAGRVEKFQRKYGWGKDKAAAAETAGAAKVEPAAAEAASAKAGKS